MKYKHKAMMMPPPPPQQKGWTTSRCCRNNARRAITSRRRRSPLLFVVLSLLALQVESQQVDCDDDEKCEVMVGNGSTCRVVGDDDDNKKKCSNPFESGCLQNLLPKYKNKKRVCNSEDSNDAVERGICVVPPFGDEYLEIRIATQSWESAMFEAWVLQVVLSELLGVPTTLETGLPDAYVNLYDSQSRFEYGDADNIKAIAKASELVDCRKASKDPNQYESCSHLITEFWALHYFQDTEEYVRKGHAEPTAGMGALGDQGLFLPKFTADRHPELMGYFGYAGEDNRRKLAETFLFPTTWKDYCDRVSPDECQSGDGVAKRPPQDETEEQKMFDQDFYTGHFRKIPELSDCDANPTTCVGHISDYPCDSMSFVEAQMYHLNIALKSNGAEAPGGGYTYEQLVEIWEAANATKSDVIGIWWTPEALYQRFAGTEAELQRVSLPRPTQECIEKRPTQDDRCSANFTARMGDPMGSCDETPFLLQKVISGSVFDATQGSKIPDALHNPGYNVLKEFQFTALQLNEMFEYWQTKRNPREAICAWVADHVDDYLQSLVPHTYPRVLEFSDEIGPLFYVAVTLGAVAAVLVIVTAWLVYRQRKRRVMITAQIEFLWLLLSGLLMIAVGAIIVAVPPTNGTCVAHAWLVNTGYALELVPLIVKVAAINRLMLAAQHMRRVTLDRRSLFGAVALIMAMILVFLSVWTALDPPHREAEYDLTDMKTEDSSTVVVAIFYCDSDSYAWWLSAVAWNALLLFCASILAFQTRKLRQDFNESQTLAMMIYSHFIFVVLRLSLLILSSNQSASVSKAKLSQYLSVVYSVDIMATIAMYFVPKFLASDAPDPRTTVFVPQSNVAKWLQKVTSKAPDNNSSSLAPPASGSKGLAKCDEDNGNDKDQEAGDFEPTDRAASMPVRSSTGDGLNRLGHWSSQTDPAYCHCSECGGGNVTAIHRYSCNDCGSAKEIQDVPETQPLIPVESEQTHQPAADSEHTGQTEQTLCQVDSEQSHSTREE